MISEKMLQKFKKLYQEEFGIELTNEEATESATELLNLMKVLMKPAPNEAK